MKTPHFKLEDYRTVLRLIQMLFNQHLKNAYYFTSIREKDGRYIRFEFNGTVFQFNCLPFGLNMAHHLFLRNYSSQLQQN